MCLAPPAKLVAGYFAVLYLTSESYRKCEDTEKIGFVTLQAKEVAAESAAAEARAAAAALRAVEAGIALYAEKRDYLKLKDIAEASDVAGKVRTVACSPQPPHIGPCLTQKLSCVTEGERATGFVFTVTARSLLWCMLAFSSCLLTLLLLCSGFTLSCTVLLSAMQAATAPDTFPLCMSLWPFGFGFAAL